MCGSCWDRALSMKIASSRCSSCGIPLQIPETSAEHLCGNCQLQFPPYSGARAFGYYAGELSRLIQGLKFDSRWNLVEPLGALLATSFYETWERRDFDLIVPVPLHPKRMRARGYNQSELLAQALARRTAIRCSVELVRTRPTLPQVGLSDSQRAANVRGAFTCGTPDAVRDKRILLIDDVMTTGATVSSAAAALIAAGALRVSVLTITRADKW